MERFLDYFIPRYYHLDLSISRRHNLLQGTVTISGKVKSETIKFHAVGLQIESVSHMIESFDGDEKDYKPCKYEYDGETLTIPITPKMAPHFYKPQSLGDVVDPYQDPYQPELYFKITYRTRLNDNMQGCYLSTYQWNGAEQRIIATQFESHYAREAFPCIDEPAAKAIFSLTLSVPDLSELDVVLANTQLSSHFGNHFNFQNTPPMSTYLLAWVIGPLQSVSTVNKNGVRVSSYCALNQPTESLLFANQTATRALEYYDEKFGLKYPLAKLDQVALPDFEAGAMENWGLVTYRESCLLADPNASVDTKLNVAVTVTHELAHQWFGNLVTMKWWDDLWLNESFATLMEYLATDALYPEFNAWRDFFTGDCVAALRRDCLPGVQSVQQSVEDPAEIPTLFDSAIVYAKGARLMLMLFRLMGEQQFFHGLRYYFERHQRGSATGDDLWFSLQPYADFDVKGFMHTWISQPGYPEISFASDKYSSGDIGNKEHYSPHDIFETTEFTERRFLIDGTTDESQWPLPEVKDDMSGHYLINLPEAAFDDQLAHFPELSNEQKLRLLIDRSLLAKARQVSSASLPALLQKFSNEDVATWSILLDIISDLKIFFPPDSEDETRYREFLRHIIYSPIRELGVQSRADDSADTKRLRDILSVVARFAHDEEAISQLAEQYRDDLSSIDPEMRSNILMAKMLTSEDSSFPVFFNRYRSESNPDLKDELLCALASARDKEHISTMIQLLEQPEIVRPQDHLYLFVYLLRNPHAKPAAIDWLYAHWDYVQKLTGDKSIEDYPRCLAGYLNTRADADRFYNFFRAHEDTPILKRTLAMAKAGIESRLQLIAQESQPVRGKINTLLKEQNGKK